MTIMVDELRKINLTLFGWGWSRACHLTTDGELEELHRFAESIGLRREWFQSRSTPHYDLSTSKRILALKKGAIFVPAKEQARKRLEILRAKAKSTEL